MANIMGALTAMQESMQGEQRKQACLHLVWAELTPLLVICSAAVRHGKHGE